MSVIDGWTSQSIGLIPVIYSAFRVAALAISAHFAVSLANHASSSFGVLPHALMPSALVRSANAGDVTTARRSADSFSSTAAVVPAGAITALNATTVKPG